MTFACFWARGFTQGVRTLKISWSLDFSHESSDAMAKLGYLSSETSYQVLCKHPATASGAEGGLRDVPEVQRPVFWKMDPEEAQKSCNGEPSPPKLKLKSRAP